MTTISTCDRCGHPHVTPHGHQACTKHKSKRDADGNLVPCSAPPVTGTDACRTHGASASQVRRAAAVNAAEAEAARQVATLGLRLDVSPTDALLEEVQWTAGHVAWLRRKVADLGTDTEAVSAHPLVWGVTKTGEKYSTEKGTETSTTESASPSIWYELYAKERAHLIAVCSAALKAGVEERRVVLAEKQGLLVSEALRRILDGLLAVLIAAGMAEQLRTVWADAVSTIVPRELRAIAGGAV